MTCSKQYPDSSVGLKDLKKRSCFHCHCYYGQIITLEVGQDLQHLIGQILVRLEYIAVGFAC